MTDASLSPRKRVPPGKRDRETDLTNYFVPPAMLVVAIAMGVASNLHLGVAPEMAIAVGAALFCAMLLCHVLLRAADLADKAQEAAAERRAVQVPSPMPAPDRITSDNLPAELTVDEAGSGPRASPALSQRDGAMPEYAPHEFAPREIAASPTIEHPGIADYAAMPSAQIPATGQLQGEAYATYQPHEEVRVDSRRDPAHAPQSAEDAEFGRGLGGVAAQDTSRPLEVAESLQVLPPQLTIGTAYSSEAPSLPPSPASPSGWLFRPVALRVPAVEGEAFQQDAVSEAAAVVAAIGALRPAIVDPAIAPRAGDPTPPAEALSPEADRIDQILKRLARQIRSGASSFAVPQPSPGEATPPALAATPPQTDADSLAAAAAARPDTALESAVDALRSTVEAMRQGAGEGEVQAPVAAAVPPNPVETRIAAIAEALAAERVDVVLAPILALAGAEARHFEVSVRLRAADGELIDAKSVASGAGLLPLLDALSVRHAAGFALNLERRGRKGAVFSTVAGESLESDGFVGDVAGRYAQGIADRMVLSFAQAEMRGLGDAQIAALGELADLGFRFALTGVADLDMDFESLRATGFQFVKLDAAVFLGGLPCGGEVVPASDLCLHFGDLGLEVIVSGIGNEFQRDNLVGCGVTYGQGPLYGEPRPIPFAAGGAMAA